MTVVELHTAFFIYYDKVQSQSYPELFSEEVDYFFNLAQDKMIHERYPKALDTIYTLVVDTLLNTVDIYPTTGYNAYECALPQDFYFYVDSNSKMQNGNFVEWRGNKVNTNFTLRQLQVNTTNKPHIREPLVVLKEDAINIFHNAEFSIPQLNLRYVKKPDTISFTGNVTSNLPLALHQELITNAVALAIESVESQRVQTVNKV